MSEEEEKDQEPEIDNEDVLNKETSHEESEPANSDQLIDLDTTEESIEETTAEAADSINIQEPLVTDEGEDGVVDSNTSVNDPAAIEGQQEADLATQEGEKTDEGDETEEKITIPDDFDELLEGALFAAGKPLSMEKMESVFGFPAVEIRACLRGIIRKLEETKSALRVEEVSKDTYVLCLASEYEDLVKPLMKSTKTGKGIFTNPAAMDMVTNIAYRQPITLSLLGKIIADKIDIPTQRKIIADLIEQGYVEKIEKGRSVRLKVTHKFTDTFGFSRDSRKMKLQILWRLKRGK